MNSDLELDKIKNLLSSRGLKATNQRIEVLYILAKNRKPLTLKDILSKIKGESAHEVTVYRMISSFKDSGIVKQIDFQDSVPYFELVDEKHDHHHIVCTSCKKVSDFTGCGSSDLIKNALSQNRDFAIINSHSFELFGICKKCSKK